VNTIGCTDYEDIEQNNGSLFYDYVYWNQQAFILIDDEYRFLLKLKIVLNHCDNTFASITGLLWDFFGNGVLPYDMGDMSMVYSVSKTIAPFALLAVELDLLPKPMGVQILSVNEH
jgi:hypothetical protein